MRAFVTGGTGFVGSHLVEELLRRDVGIRALVRSDPRWLEGLPVEIVRGNLGNVRQVRDMLADVDTVYHVGGLTRAPDESDLFAANVDATRRLLDAAEAAGVGRVLVTSSQAAAGPSAGAPVDETAPMRPLSAYGRSKAAMEEMVRGHDIAERTVVIRPPSVYGPREADIYTAIRTADKQRLFPVIGDSAAPALALVHVSDLVRGMVDAAGSEAAGGGTFFLTGERDYSWEELQAAVEAALGHRALRLRVPKRLVAPAGAAVEFGGGLFGRYPPFNREKARELGAQWLASSARAAATFGYEPVIGLEEGMRDTVRWYREHGWL